MGKRRYAMGRGRSKRACVYDREGDQFFSILVLMY